MRNDLISVITPVYNSEQYLDECIGSILNQTYNNIELILINDGSTDHSLEVCQKWAQKDSRIVLINKKNEGAAVARNAGLDIARGELIGFVDHDDKIEKTMYQTMYMAMKETNADIVMCSSFSLVNGERGKQSYPQYDSFETDGNELVKRMLSYEKIICSSVWSKLYRKNVIGDVRFHKDITLGDDYYFNGLIYPKVKKFYYCNESLYNYRIREGSLCRSDLGGHFFDKYKVAELLENEYKNKDWIKKEWIDNFKLAINFEILYDMMGRKCKRSLYVEWKKKLIKQYKLVKKRKKISLKDKIKILSLGYFPKAYARVVREK